MGCVVLVIGGSWGFQTSEGAAPGLRRDGVAAAIGAGALQTVGRTSLRTAHLGVANNMKVGRRARSCINSGDRHSHV
jgi:hypothetical protein